jgi:hypothetical protein
LPELLLYLVAAKKEKKTIDNRRINSQEREEEGRIWPEL